MLQGRSAHWLEAVARQERGAARVRAPARLLTCCSVARGAEFLPVSEHYAIIGGDWQPGSGPKPTTWTSVSAGAGSAGDHAPDPLYSLPAEVRGVLPRASPPAAFAQEPVCLKPLREVAARHSMGNPAGVGRPRDRISSYLRRILGTPGPIGGGPPWTEGVWSRRRPRSTVICQFVQILVNGLRGHKR